MEIISMPAQPYVGIRRRVKPLEMGAALGEILPAVFGWVMQHGHTPAGPPMTLYLAHDEVNHEFEILGGCFITATAAGEGEIESGVIPAGDVATTVHCGPYHTLGESHFALRDWILVQGRTPSPVSWETYLTDPCTVPDPADYRTQIGWLLA